MFIDRCNHVFQVLNDFKVWNFKGKSDGDVMMRVQSWQIDRDACKKAFKCSENAQFSGRRKRFHSWWWTLMVSQRARQGPHPLEGLKWGGQLQQLVCWAGLLSFGFSCMRGSRGAGGRGWTRKEEQPESLTVHLHHRSDRPAELLGLLNERGWSPRAFFMLCSERRSSNFKISRAETGEDASVEPSRTARADFLF